MCYLPIQTAAPSTLWSGIFDTQVGLKFARACASACSLSRGGHPPSTPKQQLCLGLSSTHCSDQKSFTSRECKTAKLARSLQNQWVLSFPQPEAAVDAQA